MIRGLLLSLVFFVICFSLTAAPPHPLKKNGIIPQDIEQIKKDLNSNRGDLPQNVLVLMVEFQDVEFDLVPDYPDFLAHDFNFINRYMIHLKDYLYDASHGLYELNYLLLDEVLKLDNVMGYYGDDDLWSERVVEFAQESIAKADQFVNYSQYDALIIFHAGAGQESDIYDRNKDELWSTFLSNSNLKENIAPDDDNFIGIETDDNAYIKNVVICPESQWQPDFVEGDMILGTLGVVAHEFGHQLGLPTLYDNRSSNGKSQGIGNFGLMGTGAWNASGYVPPLPCAWSRYYLGWENPQVVTMDQFDLFVSHNLDSNSQNPLLYKVPLSEKEYFLIENMQQNPDKSMETWKFWEYYDNNNDGIVDDSTLFMQEPVPSFTFAIVDSQKYYPSPNDSIAMFDFMTNSYRGCEWNFFSPGLGGPDSPVIDGSGLMIWHVDEYVINEQFEEDFSSNSINAISQHKGVDLEEADGQQNLDTAVYNPYMYGGPYDSFRDGINNYFGKEINPSNNLYSLPTAVSNYGRVPLEIFNISESKNEMNFSVRFDWYLDTGYVGANEFPMTFLDIDLDEEDEIVFPMPNGEIFAWNDNQIIDEYPINIDSLAVIYSIDETNSSIIFPCEENGISSLNLVRNNSNEMIYESNSGSWKYPSIIVDDDISMFDSNQYNFNLKLLSYIEFENEAKILVFDDNYSLKDEIIVNKLISNMVYSNGFLYYLHSAQDQAENIIQLVKMNLQASDGNVEYLSTGIEINEDKINLSYIPDMYITEDDVVGCFIAFTENRGVYLVDDEVFQTSKVDYINNLNGVNIPSFGDINENGIVDIIIGGENNYIALSKNGEILNTLFDELTNPDSLNISSGVILADIDDDEKQEIIGNMSKNRLCIWEDDFHLKNGYPLAFGERSLNLPLLYDQKDTLFIYIGSDNGKVYRHYLGETPENFDDYKSIYRYANKQRTATFTGPMLKNKYSGSSTFVKDQVFVFPCPYNEKLDNEIFLNVMVNKEVSVQLKVFDIAGNQIIENTAICYPFENNRDKFFIPKEKLVSGVYFALLKASGEQKMVKFVIEK